MTAMREAMLAIENEMIAAFRAQGFPFRIFAHGTTNQSAIAHTRTPMTKATT